MGVEDGMTIKTQLRAANERQATSKCIVSDGVFTRKDHGIVHIVDGSAIFMRKSAGTESAMMLSRFVKSPLDFLGLTTYTNAIVVFDSTTPPDAKKMTQKSRGLKGFQGRDDSWDNMAFEKIEANYKQFIATLARMTAKKQRETYANEEACKRSRDAAERCLHRITSELCTDVDLWQVSKGFYMTTYEFRHQVLRALCGSILTMTARRTLRFVGVHDPGASGAEYDIQFSPAGGKSVREIVVADPGGGRCMEGSWMSEGELRILRLVDEINGRAKPGLPLLIHSVDMDTFLLLGVWAVRTRKKGCLRTEVWVDMGNGGKNGLFTRYNENECYNVLVCADTIAAEYMPGAQYNTMALFMQIAFMTKCDYNNGFPVKLEAILYFFKRWGIRQYLRPTDTYDPIHTDAVERLTAICELMVLCRGYRRLSFEENVLSELEGPFLSLTKLKSMAARARYDKDSKCTKKHPCHVCCKNVVLRTVYCVYYYRCLGDGNYFPDMRTHPFTKKPHNWGFDVRTDNTGAVTEVTIRTCGKCT